MINFSSVKLENISKGFEGKTVLDQINCEFFNKEVHVILGKSGTGKSVLLKMIIGLMSPDAGRLMIDNENLTEAIKKNNLILSYIFQSSALLNSLNVLDNITIFLDEHNVGTKDEISIKNLADKIALVCKFKGEIIWDSEKPNGTPRKKVDTSKINSLGWYSETKLDEGLKLTYNYYLKEIEDNIVRT